MNFNQMRPELTDKTIRLYNKELKLLLSDYDETDPLSLMEKMNLITLEFGDLKHIFLNTEGNKRNYRIAVYRNLIEFFKDEIKEKDYNKIDDLILFHRV